jgi:hypothetical protein
VCSRRLKIDGRGLPKGFVRVMSWSPQRSPQACQSCRYLPFSTTDSIALYSNNCLPGLSLPPFPPPDLPPIFSAGKIDLETHSPHLVCPIILGLFITHLILYPPVKIFDRPRPFSLSNHQQPCHKLRVISRRESRLLVAKRTA